MGRKHFFWDAYTHGMHTLHGTHVLNWSHYLSRNMYNKRIFDITGKTSSQKTSSTWNHFTEPENGMVTCKKCGTEMSSKYVHNLTRHHKHCEKGM